MSLNTRLGIAAIAIVGLSPILVPLALCWWIAIRLRREPRPNLRALPAPLASTVADYAAAMFPDAPERGWSAVTENVDRYIDRIRSPRRWRLIAVLWAMEFAPVLRGHRPFSFASPAARRAFVRGPLENAGGLLRLIATGRQLVRLGYWAEADRRAAIGFVPHRAVAARSRVLEAPAPDAELAVAS